MLRTTLLAASLAALAGLHAADEYRWEAGLGYAALTADSDPESEATQLVARGRYHLLAPVGLDRHPWEEAGFLAHSTWIEARVGRLTQEFGPIDADGLTYGVTGRYADPEVPVTAEVSLDWFTIEDDDYGVELDTFVWEVRAGWWVLPNLVAGLGYEAASQDDGSDETTDSTLFAWGKWVHGLTADLDLNVEAEVGRIAYDDADGDNVAATVIGDLYLLKQYGVGIQVGTQSGDVASQEGLTLGVRGSAWFTPNVGVRAVYTTFAASDEDAGVDDDLIGAELVGRF